jgi:hypothetical protein
MGKVLSMVGWSCGLIAAVGFFLPWVKLVSVEQRPGHAAKAVIAELSEDAERPYWKQMLLLRSEEKDYALSHVMVGVSGYALLEDMRRPERKRQHRELDDLFLTKTDQLPARGLLLYALPASALISACCLALVRRPFWVILLPLIGSGCLYALIRTRINETYFERLVSGAQIGIGLWLSLYALVVLVLLLLIHLIRAVVAR